MKIKSKASLAKRLTTLFAVFAFVTLIIPTTSILAKAQQAISNSENKAAARENKADNKDNKIEKNANTNAKTCDKITAAGERITNNIADLDTKFQARKEARLQRFEKKVADAERRREVWRKSVDANIEAQLKKMMDSAKTDAQKDAIIAYEKTLKNAIAARRLAIDQAQEAFFLHLSERFSLKRDNLETILLAYRNDRKAAFDEAQSQCAAGTDMNQVKADLKTSLKQAREKFQEQMKNREKGNADLKSYIDERNQAIRKAQDDFKATMTLARTELKKALGETSLNGNEATIKQEQSEN